MFSECREARTAKHALELLIRQAGIGNGRLALECRELLPHGGIAGGVDLLLEQVVYQHIYATDEKARHRGHVADIFTSGSALLQGVEIGVGHLPVILDGENERDIDIDPLSKRAANGGDTRRRGRNLDHQIGPINGLPEAAHLCERPLSIMRQVRGDFDAHKPILPVCLIIDGTEQVGNHTFVGHCQRFVDFFGSLALAQQLLHLLIVGSIVSNRMFKNGRVPPSLEENLSQAQADLAALEQVGINYDQVTRQLQVEGVQKFIDSFQTLFQCIERQQRKLQ